MDYRQMAEQILQGVGGKENVAMLTHCATRLRFNLVDESKADDKKVQSIKGVSGISNKGGQYQVIIGSDVGEPYKELKDMGVGGSEENTAKQPEKKQKIGTVIVDTLSGIFTPILPAITGAGMLKAILALLPLAGVNESSQTYQIISILADAAYYFLPLLLAWSAAMKFKCNPCLAITLAGLLVHPNLIALLAGEETVRFLGIPVKAATYSYSVIPIILIVWLMSYVEKLAYKYVPKCLRYFLAPLIVFLITGIVGLIVLGPIGAVLGDGLVAIFDFLIDKARVVTMVFTGAFMPILVLTGMHHGFTPITVALFAAYGFDPIMFPAALASNMSQAGSSFAVAIRAKDSDVRSQAASAGLTALMGVTEPALFGVNIRYKRPLYGCFIGGAAGALFASLMNLKAYANAAPGLASIAMFIGEEKFNILWAVLTIVIAVGVSFIATWILGGNYLRSAEEEEKEIAQADTYPVCAPMKGQIVPLEEVPDDTFASGMLGKGVAVIPEEGVVASPVYGTVESVFDTQHAIAIKGISGEEILIHIGLDTVTLNGAPFRIHAKAGDKVKAGDVLGKFYPDKIKEAGLNTITPVIVTNPDDFDEIEMLTGDKAERGDQIMIIHKKADGGQKHEA